LGEGSRFRSKKLGREIKMTTLGDLSEMRGDGARTRESLRVLWGCQKAEARVSGLGDVSYSKH